MWASVYLNWYILTSGSPGCLWINTHEPVRVLLSSLDGTLPLRFWVTVSFLARRLLLLPVKPIHKWGDISCVCHCPVTKGKLWRAFDHLNSNLWTCSVWTVPPALQGTVSSHFVQSQLTLLPFCSPVVFNESQLSQATVLASVRHGCWSSQKIMCAACTHHFMWSCRAVFPRMKFPLLTLHAREALSDCTADQKAYVVLCLWRFSLMKKTFGWEAKHLQITKKQVQPLNSRWPRLLPCRLYQGLRGENQLLLQKSTWQRHDSSSYPQNCHLAPIHMRREQIIFCIAPSAAPLPTRKLIAWGSIVRSKAIIEINCRVIIGKHFSPHSICENGRGVMVGFQLSAPAPDHLVSLQVSTPDIHQLRQPAA